MAVWTGSIEVRPRAWAERSLNIVDWEVLDAGGHFGSWEQPEMFINSVRRAL
jgi:pimeloyl-ACP methyl ester carboxylesterase